MRDKISSAIQQLPSWLLFLAGLIGVIGPDVIQYLTNAHYSMAAIVAQRVVSMALFVTALAKQSDTLKSKGELAAMKAKRPPPVPTAVLFAFAMVPACSWFQSNPQVVSSVSDIAACVLQHDTEAVNQIASECGGIAIADVLKILSAEQAAKARAMCPPPATADAGPGK